ncbi:sel1 repeat family protein, partial [Kitasatospora sp. NPDC001574]
MRLIGKNGTGAKPATTEADTEAWAESPERNPGALPAQRTSGLTERRPAPGYGPDSLVHVPTSRFTAEIGPYGALTEQGGPGADAGEHAGFDSASFETALAAREQAALEARHRQAADDGD